MTRRIPLDYTLKVLELIADSKGLKLEDVDGYVALCELLTDLDLDGCSNRPFTSQDVHRTFKALVAYVVPSWADRPYVFHQICQPVDIYDLIEEEVSL